MPAFTMAAECKYALTGVGASMALGNQRWKGAWADFVKAPNKTSTNIAGYRGLACNTLRSAKRTDKSAEPTVTIISTAPASNARPPAAVTRSALSAPIRDSSRWDQNPMSKKDVKLVASQNMYSTSKLSAITTPSIAPMNNIK